MAQAGSSFSLLYNFVLYKFVLTVLCKSFSHAATPFVIEQALLSRTLIVRQEELRQVEAALAQGRKLFLHVWLQKMQR